MQLNEYDKELSKKFQKSDIKPDKQFSFLPTVLSIVGDISGKIALDLGCGDGFFTKALALVGTKQVIGIDNSKEQLQLANSQPHKENITYQFGDIFKDALPKSDIILSPFVLNYAQSTEQLEFLIENIYQSLSEGGKAVLVVDLPRGKNLKKFGSIKTIEGGIKDGAKIKIDLYNGEEFICTLYSVYYTPETLENILYKTGFKNVKWHKPIISKEGVEKFGEGFWKGFQENSELGYISVEKV